MYFSVNLYDNVIGLFDGKDNKLMNNVYIGNQLSWNNGRLNNLKFTINVTSGCLSLLQNNKAIGQ